MIVRYVLILACTLASIFAPRPVIGNTSSQRQEVQRPIPNGALPEVRSAIEKLSAINALDRVRGARALSDMGASAAIAAPFLIDLLADDTQGRWVTASQSTTVQEGRSTEKPDEQIRETRTLGVYENTISYYAQPAGAASEALKRIGSAAIPALADGLKHPNPLVRSRVIEVLSDLSDVRVVDLLISALNDSENGKIAALSLGKRKEGRDGVMDLLISASRDSNKNVRCSALYGLIYGLGKQEDPRVIEALIDALSDSDPAIRRTAASGLGSCKDLRVVELLIAALGDKNGDVRSAARQSLHSITGVDLGGNVNKWQKWWAENKSRPLAIK